MSEEKQKLDANTSAVPSFPPRMIWLATLICLLFLVLVQAGIVFQEGWNLQGYPHTYAYTALQNHYDTVVGYPGTYNSAWDLEWNDNLHSPLYLLTSFFGKVGRPTPSWFRLAAISLFVLFFVVCLWMPPKPTLMENRLVIAVTVSSAPMVFYVGRHLEDFIIHMILLTIGAGIALRTEFLRKHFESLIFVLLPIVDLLLTHTVTNSVIALFAFAGMYLYCLIKRFKEVNRSRRPKLKTEMPRLVFFIAAFLIAAKYRLSEGLMAYWDYSQTQTGNGHFLQTILHGIPAYSGVLVFSAAGIVICLVAVINILPRFRDENAGLYIMWVVVPLVLLFISEKRNAYYVWMLTPALAILAGSVIAKMPKKIKTGWLLLCLAFAILHLFCMQTPFDGIVNQKNFQSPEMAIKHCCSTDGKSFDTANKILKLADTCGITNGSTLLVAKQSNLFPIEIYYTMLYENQKPEYRFLGNDGYDMGKTVAIWVGELPPKVDPIFNEDITTLFATERHVTSEGSMHLFCPKESVQLLDLQQE